MKQRTIVIIILILLVAGGLYFYKTKYSQKSSESTVNFSNDSEISKEPPALAVTEDEKPASNDKPSVPNKSEAIFSDEESLQSPDVMVHAISYDGNKFSPANITVKAGDIIFFENESTKSFWPASGDHPSHELYPEFDAGKPIAVGQTFEFKFNKVGQWSFHDHLNSSAGGVITVVK